MSFLAWGHYGHHYAHHYGGAGDWLAHTVMRGIVYATISRVFHYLNIWQVLAIAGICAIAFLAVYKRP